MKKTLLALIVANEARGLAVVASMLAGLYGAPAHAQNSPLSGLPPRGTVQGTDIIPIMPAGGAQLEQTTVAALLAGTGTGSGSVTSVGLAMPAYLSCTGGPITSSGTISCSLVSQSANTVFAGPATGSAAAPTWRALATADLPASGVTPGAYASPTSVTVNTAGQVTAITASCGQQCTAPNLLKFGPPTLIPYYDPQPAGLIDVLDTFGSTGTFTATLNSSTFTVSGGVGTIGCSGSCTAYLSETSDATLIAPEFFNAIKVTAQTPASSYSNIYVGVVKDVNNYIGVYYDSANHAIHTEYRYSGTIQNGTIKSITLTPPYWIGASLVANSLSGWYKTSALGPWIYAGNVQMPTSNIDYSVTANFATAGFKTAVFTSYGAAGSFSVANLQGGRFGGVCMRDIKPVTNGDWTTYQPGGNIVDFVATVCDPGGNSPIGVFTLNLNTQAITETGVICDSRVYASMAHTFCADNAGDVIYHANGDREVLSTSWETFPTSAEQVLYDYVTSGSQGDVLTTNLSVVPVAALTLPLSGAVGAYDPALAYDAVHSRYLMAYTITNNITATNQYPANFYPALAYASTPTGTWTLIGADTSLLGNWEGTSFANVQGVIYELAGGPYLSATPASLNCSSSRVYDETFTYLGGLLGATFDTNNSTTGLNCSHPTLFQHPDGQHQVVFTFLSPNGSYTSGNNATIGQPAIEISTP